MIGEPRFDFDEISSTNDAAAAAAKQGVPDGAVFVAQHQTAGRGRRGARWNAQAGESVLMTVVLSPKGSPATAWRLGWLACLSVISTLRDLGLAAQCKWPNDVVVNGKKIAGVLVETSTKTGDGYFAYVGIGVNILQRDFGDPSNFRITPTSVALELSTPAPTLNAVVDKICRRLDALYFADGSGWEEAAASYRGYIVLGEKQTGIDPVTGESIVGRLADIREEDGAALLQISDNQYRYAFPEIILV